MSDTTTARATRFYIPIALAVALACKLSVILAVFPISAKWINALDYISAIAGLGILITLSIHKLVFRQSSLMVQLWDSKLGESCILMALLWQLSAEHIQAWVQHGSRGFGWEIGWSSLGLLFVVLTWVRKGKGSAKSGGRSILNPDPEILTLGLTRQQ